MNRTCCRLIGWGAIVFPVAALAQATAAADEAPKQAPLSFSVGVKLWANTWDSWVTSRTGTGVALGTLRYQTVQAVGSETKLSAIPFASLRYKDFFGSVSVMTRTRYSLLDTATPGGFEISASRKEVDVNTGYFVLPGLALTAGFKQLTQVYGPDSYRWRGPIVGVTGSAGLSGGWALYGSAGIGFLKADFPAVQADASGKTKFNADYRLGEFGLAYGTVPEVRFVKSIVGTLGYRLQNVATKGYGLAVTDPQGGFTPNASVSLKDTTQGPVFSLNVSF